MSALILIIRLLIVCFSPRDPSVLTYRIAELVIFFDPAMSVLRLSASALPLSFPGVYLILNLYCPMSSAHLTWRRLSSFVVVKLSRFLWSEKIVSFE
jgi:hypothetical protein